VVVLAMGKSQLYLFNLQMNSFFDRNNGGTFFFVICIFPIGTYTGIRN